MKKDNEQPEKKQSTQLPKFALIALLFFFAAFYYLFLMKNTHKTQEVAAHHSVTFSKNVLTVFGDKYDFAREPDKFSEHGDYFLVRQPMKQKTTVYSLSREKIVKVISELVIDYDGKNTLYFKNGVQTYFNGKSLQISCSVGYILSPRQVLCIIPKEQDNLANKLISINPETLEQSDMYVPTNTLSTVSYIKNTLYVGEYTLQTQQFALSINQKSIPVNTIIDSFYTMQGNLYFASLPNGWNNNTASYAQITVSKNDITAKTIDKGQIVLWNGK